MSKNVYDMYLDYQDLINESNRRFSESGCYFSELNDEDKLAEIDNREQRDYILSLDRQDLINIKYRLDSLIDDIIRKGITPTHETKLLAYGVHLIDEMRNMKVSYKKGGKIKF